VAAEVSNAVETAAAPHTPVWHARPVLLLPGEPVPAPPSPPQPPPVAQDNGDGGGAAGLPSYDTLSRIAFTRGAAVSGLQLRPLRLPRDLVPRFEAIAQPNTFTGERGLETCGVLMGRPVPAGQGGGFEVTLLVVPKQVGKPDDCEMHGEEELLGLCLSRGLIQLGWIHTHPSQACFMSSMDLHTHAGFQLSLRESVAIVLAPRDPACRVAFFRLTDDASGGGSGLQLIQACDVRDRMLHRCDGTPAHKPPHSSHSLRPMRQHHRPTRSYAGFTHTTRRSRCTSRWVTLRSPPSRSTWWTCGEAHSVS
jgi:STAM-binding protein